MMIYIQYYKSLKTNLTLDCSMIEMKL